LFIIHKDRKGKLTSESSIDNYKIEIFDEKTKSEEVIFGGRILNLVNDIAKNVATSHAEIKCETIGIDFIRYFSPIQRGDILVCKAQVNHVWNDIIEVGVKVMAEDFRTLDQKKILSAYFIFRTESGIEIPQIIPENESDKKRCLEAEKRKKIREKRKSI
jgi:acyl-CoA hydrolase